MILSASSSTATTLFLPPEKLTLRNNTGNGALRNGEGIQQKLVPRGRHIVSDLNSIPKKPMRPLTAYHIFFQIEREFVIQTTAGEDADKSIHDNKVYLDNVPQRYRNIKLLPDWYAGPGKRQKRKHRKQHGKIGFLELSRVISTRWAQLDEIDPETKGFVQKIAKQELDEYYTEMKHYKEVTKDLIPEALQAVTRPGQKKKTRKRKSANKTSSVKQPEQQPPPPSRRPEMVPSLYQAVDFVTPSSLQLKHDIDYFLARIDKKSQQLLPPSFGAAIQDQRQRNILQQEIFEEFLRKQRNDSDASSVRPKSVFSERSKNQCKMNSTSCSSPRTVEVDICDDEILQLWKSHH